MMRTLVISGVTDSAGAASVTSPGGAIAGVVRGVLFDDDDLAAGATISLVGLNESDSAASTTALEEGDAEIALIHYVPRITVAGGGAGNAFRVLLLIEADRGAVWKL